MLTLPGGHSLKRGNLLFHLAAFALRTFEFFLFMFRDPHEEGESLTAFFTLEFIYRHFVSS